MALFEMRYWSEALLRQNAAFVIHPDPDVPKPYHAMLLLHGLSDDHSIWLRRTGIERYVQGLPLVVVMPNADRSFYCDALEGFPYFQAIAYELPSIVEHHFGPTGGWCTTGLSMGGYGALRLALGRPDLFRSAVSHSGALMFARWPYREDEFSREFLRVLGEDLQPNGPNDLVRLAREAAPLPKLRLDCGVDDFLLDMNREFHRELLETGIEHEYEEFPGDHNWAYWDEHVQDAIAFHRRVIGF